VGITGKNGFVSRLAVKSNPRQVFLADPVSQWWNLVLIRPKSLYYLTNSSAQLASEKAR